MALGMLEARREDLLKVLRVRFQSVPTRVDVCRARIDGRRPARPVVRCRAAGPDSRNVRGHDSRGVTTDQPSGKVKDPRSGAVVVRKVTALIAVTFAVPAYGLEPKDVFLVVTNRNSPESRSVAAHCVAKRGVPKENVVELPVSGGRRDFPEGLRRADRPATAGAWKDKKDKVKVIVLVYGIAVAIAAPPLETGEGETGGGAGRARRGEKGRGRQAGRRRLEFGCRKTDGAGSDLG